MTEQPTSPSNEVAPPAPLSAAPGGSTATQPPHVPQTGSPVPPVSQVVPQAPVITRPTLSPSGAPLAPPVIAPSDRPNIFPTGSSADHSTMWESRRGSYSRFTRTRGGNTWRGRGNSGGGSSQDERVPLPAGTRVGDYTISSKIGIGGFGITYFATHTEEGTPVAIKEHLPAGLATREPNSTVIIHTSPEQEARFKATLEEFQEEVTVLMGLSHPGIIPILSAFTANGTAYYVMPFQEGTPMSIVEQATLDQEQQAQGARHNKRLLLSMLSTLDYLRMHQIVHRDIKTDNILVTPDGSTILLDFGSARQLQPGKVFTNVYTPDFCAPEQSRSKNDEEMSETIGPWTDLYALGVCFYYLLTHLFPPRSDMRVIATVDPYTPLAGRADLEKLYGAAFLRAIDRALELKIRDRWQSAAAWRMAIEEGVVAKTPKVTRHMRTVICLFTVVLLILTGISLWALDEKARAERSIDNSMRFVELMLNDFNQELSDIPGSTRLQRIFGEHLHTFLNGIEEQEMGSDMGEKILNALTSSWRNYGTLCLQQGKLEDADAAYGHAVDYMRQLLQLNPEHNARRYDLASVLLKRVVIARSRNQVAQVRRYLGEAESILQALIREEPTNPDYICSTGSIFTEEAYLARYEGKADLYREALENMLETYRHLEEQYPEYVPAREGLGYALESSAQYAVEHGNFATSAAYLDEAKGIFTSLSAQYPYRLSFQKGLALVYYSLGKLYSHMSDSAGNTAESSHHDELALEALRKHIELVNHLETQDENKVEYPYMACRALSAMVDILLRTGQPNLAEAHSRTIMRKTRKLRANAPDNMDYAVMEAKAWRGLALAHSRAPRYAVKAAEEFGKYRLCIEKILQQSRESAAMQFLYTDALLESAVHGLISGQVVQARRWLQQAETILNKLVRGAPENPAYAERLQRVHAELDRLPATRSGE